MSSITRKISRNDPFVFSKLDAERARLQKKRQAAEKELQRQMDAEKQKREAEKKLRDEERKREEEAKKHANDERRKQDEVNVARISPEDPTRRLRSDTDGNDSIDLLLQSGGADMDLDIESGENNVESTNDEMLRSPPKKNARFSNIVQQLHPPHQNPTTLKEPRKQVK